MTVGRMQITLGEQCGPRKTRQDSSSLGSAARRLTLSSIHSKSYKVLNTLCCHGVGLKVRAARDDSGTNGIQIQMRQRAHHMSQPRPVLHTLKAVT
eukprot:scaffold86003_cov77-Phaeocystis_antarctica.AAC.1